MDQRGTKAYLPKRGGWGIQNDEKYAIGEAQIWVYDKELMISWLYLSVKVTKGQESKHGKIKWGCKMLPKGFSG